MIVHDVEIVEADGWVSCRYRIELETAGARFSKSQSNVETLWFRWPADYYVPEQSNADAALLVCFPIAMRLGERVHVKGGVSGKLIWNVLEAMAIYHSYYPDYAQIVPLEAEAVERDRKTYGRMGSFYSGGVDSLFNIAEAMRLNKTYGTAPVTDLWLVRGMDISLDDHVMWEHVKTQLMSNDHLPKDTRVVDIHTNARDLHAGFVGWTEMGFSPILGGIAKCFTPIVEEALIGSYGKYEDVAPHASSPLVDPMWSCGAQRVRHFSCRVNRAEKIQAICETMPEALKVLRVCWKNPDGAYNCGVCEKCLRTQMQLKVFGKLDDSTTFAKPLTPATLRELTVPTTLGSFYTRDFWRDLARQARGANLDDYAQIIEEKLKRANRIASLRKAMPAAVKRRVRPLKKLLRVS